MATEQQLLTALRAADAAGNHDDAQRIAGMIQAQRSQPAQPKPTSFWQGVKEGIFPAVNNAQTALEFINPASAIPRLIMGGGGRNARTAQADRSFAAAPTRGSTAGKIVGGIAGTIPTMALPGMSGAGLIPRILSQGATQGAASGAMLSSARNVQGVARDAAIGAGLGKGGELVAKGVGAMIGGRNVSPNVRLLAREGITMTPGQLGGKNSVRQFVEDKVLGSIPGISNIPDAAAARGTNDLRRAVANRVLKPIGDSVEKGTPIDTAMIGQLQDKVYGNLENAAGNLQLQLDPDLALGMSNIVQNAPRMVGDEGAKQIQANVEHIVKMTNSQPITGQVLRDTLGEIRSTASGAQGELRSQLWSLHDELANALERQNAPEASAAFTNAREAATLMKRMESAASKSTNGEFGPTQLLQAARQRGFGTTTGNIANGDARLMDLANAAADVMRNKTANSGTVPRALAMKALAGEGSLGLGAIGLGALGHPLPAAAIGTSMLGYVPGIAEILQRMALDRPQVLQQIGRGVERASPLVSNAAVAGLLPR